MKIKKQGAAWYAEATYQERVLLKAAGFLWHGGGCWKTCVGCKENVPLRVWWTAKVENASRLTDYAEGTTKNELEAASAGRKATLAASRATDADIQIPAPDGLTYLPFQRAGIAYAMARESTLIADEMGLGKQQPVDSLVLTPAGWRMISSVTVGDVVIGSDGQPTKVTGVFPQGVKPSYRVRFSDGSSVETGPEHLWTVAYWCGGRRLASLTVTTDQLRTRPTFDMSWPDGRETKLDLARTTLYLPMLNAPVEFTALETLPVPAYTLGQLIANGALMQTSASLTVNTLDWPEIRKSLEADGVEIGAVHQYGGATRIIIKDLIGRIRELGLAVASGHKVIPGMYLRAKIADRIALLHGLMDGDGSISAERNKLSYSTTSYELALGVQELIECLGGIASIDTYDRTAEDKPTEYRVRLRLPATVAPFRVSRKLNRYHPGKNALPCRTVVSVEYVRDVESVCIAVEAEDHLYATEHAILTHNTIQALGLINADESIKNVLVVCPATLRLNWLREAQKWLVRKFDYYVVETGDPVPAGANFVIVNFNRIVGKPGAKVFASLIERQFEVLIADEAHYVKNPKAQRTLALLGKDAKKSPVVGLVARARRKLFLTGTPILNRPVEIFPLLSTICPAEFGNFWKFVNRYCAPKHNGFGYDFTGASHLDELQEKMRANCMVRRLKKDVLTELPPKTRQVVAIPPNGASKAVEAEAQAIAQHEDTIDELEAQVALAKAAGNEEEYEAAVSKLREAMAIAFEAIAQARHDVALAKVPYVLEHLDNMIEEDVAKIIVMAHHHDVVDAIATHFGASAVVLTGREPQDEKQTAVDRFQNDPTVKVFIGSITAAGVGITLTAASRVVFAELDWVPANVTQAEDRAHRIGQHENVLVQHIVLDGSLDARMAKSIVRKQEIADKALDVLPREAVLETRNASDPVRKPMPKTIPAATPEERDAAHLAMQMLAGMCDGARQLDDRGFSKFDARIGHGLATHLTLSDGQVILAKRLATKYQRQLPDSILATLKIERSAK